MFELNHYIAMASQAIASISYPSAPAGLYEPIAYTMSLGGKRLRPTLTLMCCHTLGGDCNKAINPAIGIELFHNFTLLHDDVMDRADLRRGKPTVHKKWNDNVAILSGDTMLTMATQYVAHSDERFLKEALQLFNDTAIEVYEGQQYDMDFENRIDVTQDEYIEMIRLKTSVLLGCACKMGAIVAGASQDDKDAIYRFGMYLGLAFQLQDDILDVYGNPATFGKAIGGDIMNNKKTFMLINALNLASADDRSELLNWINAPEPNRDLKVAAVTAIYDRANVRTVAEERMEHYNNLAIAAIDDLSACNEAKQTFRNFANTLLHRNY